MKRYEFEGYLYDLCNISERSDPNAIFYTEDILKILNKLMMEFDRLSEKKNAACVWIQEDDEWGSWTTECGKSCVTEGTLEENGFKYCSYCGRLIFETVYYEEEEEDE